MHEQAARRQIHLFVSGRVQGVGFRYFVYETAEREGISGWVRNLPDGRVEIVAQGTVLALEAFVRAVQKGPPSSHVESLAKQQEPLSRPFPDFRVNIF